IEDYYRQRGLSGPDLQQETATVRGGFVKVESITVGLQWGLRFLSLMMLILGTTLALLLWQAARGLRGPAGAGYPRAHHGVAFGGSSGLTGIRDGMSGPAWVGVTPTAYSRRVSAVR